LRSRSTRRAPTTSRIATQALEWTPPATAFGVFRTVVDATDSISFLVKTVGDIAIDLAAGGMLLEAT
jgi:hypothetical protein